MLNGKGIAKWYNENPTRGRYFNVDEVHNVSVAKLHKVTDVSDFYLTNFDQQLLKVYLSETLSKT